MITIGNQSTTRKHQAPGRRPSGSTEDPYPARMTPSQARLAAQEMLVTGLSRQAWEMLDRLATCGVMSAAQLGIAPRTLRRYSHSRLIDRLPFSSREVLEAFEQYGLPGERRKHATALLYALGPVGIEIAKLRHPVPPLAGYLGFPLARLLHDVALNEVVLRLGAAAVERGWQATWLGPYETALYTNEEVEILEPDAMLVLAKGDEERRFLIEFHNEADRVKRAQDKVDRYEAAYSKAQLWQERWGTDVFPRLLTVFRISQIGRAYQQAVSDGTRKIHCCYYGRMLESVLVEPLVWFNFNTGKQEPILPEAG